MTTAAISIRPMPLRLALLFFGVPSLVFLATMRWVVPRLDAAGALPIVGFAVLALPHVLLFVGALVACRLEGHGWRWSELAARLRLNPMSRQDWLWALGGALGNIALYLLVYVGARPFVQWLHDLAPDAEALGRILGDATTFVGYPLKGNAWLLGVYFVFYFFNVLGEELWWRGTIFPRQELAHGARTWIVHGSLWAAFHAFSPYNVVMVLPGALLLAWIVQKRRNTWIFVIAHASLNGLAMIRIVKGIFG